MPEPARILLIEDPTAPERAEPYEHAGPFGTWAAARCPDLLSDLPRGTVHRRGGSEEVPHGELAAFVPDDGELIVVVMPPAGVETLVAIAINIAISLALTALSAILFPPPDQPAFADTPKANAVYQTNLPTNPNRLHEMLPVLYGSLTYTADLAAYAYSRYADNDQYVYALLVVTCGECEVNNVFAGETNVDDLPDGAVRWKVFGPGDHDQVHGKIGKAFGLWEDVVTSPDVASLDLRAATSAQTQKVPAEFISPDKIRLLATGSTVDPFEAGASVIVSGTTSNNGSFTIAAIDKATTHTDLDVSAGITDEGPSTTLQRAFDDQALATRNGRQQVWKVTEEPAGGALTLSPDDAVNMIAAGVDQNGIVADYTYRLDYTESEVVAGRHTLKLKGVSGGLVVAAFPAGCSVYKYTGAPTFDTSGIPKWTGPFRVAKAGQEIRKIEIDLAFPAGLYKANASTGELEEDDADFRFQIQRIDDAGNPLGDWETYDLSISTTDILASGEPLNTPIRLSHEIDVGGGQWRIRGRRTSAESAAASDQSRCVWERLKGYRVLQDAPVYGKTTLLALEFRASAGLSDAAIGRVRVDAHRRLPQIRDPYDGSTLGLSRSPVRALYDLCCNRDYGLGLDPAVYLDVGELRAARALHSAAGLTFDHVFTDQSSAWEALRLILQPALAEPLVYGGKVTVMQGGPKTLRTMLFSPVNVKAGTLKVSFGFRSAGDPDGVKVVWRDPASLAQQEALWPTASVRPTEVQIYGVSDGAVALDHAKARWRLREGAQTLVEFETGPEARIPRRGDLVGLSWPVFGWGDAALVTAISGLELTLDRPAPDVGGNRWAAIRSETGGVVGPVEMSKTGPRKITLAADPGVDLFALGGGQEPTHVAIGKGGGFLLDLVVDGIEMADGGGARISAKGYLAGAFDGTVFEGVET